MCVCVFLLYDNDEQALLQRQKFLSPAQRLSVTVVIDDDDDDAAAAAGMVSGCVRRRRRAGRCTKTKISM